MIENGKFKVGVSADQYLILRRDAALFEIYGDNGTEINMNGFLSRLIVGYFRRYREERSEKLGQIKEMIGPWLPGKERTDEIAGRIMAVVQPDNSLHRGKNTKRLSVTPTRETDRIITKIKEITPRHAEFLGEMFADYCEKPLYERERIIFREEVEILNKACKGKSVISFTTSANPGRVHHVIPYDLVVGVDEMNNYLLCQEYNEKKQKNEAISYRLCRIIEPDYSGASVSLEDEVVRYLELMKKLGPQYAVKEDSEICVRLTPDGQRSFRQIYFARPVEDKSKTVMLEDGSALYYFDASPDQVFRFVIRFRAGEAEIISPPELRERICRHYRKSLALYEKD